ncbi:type II toxin-antitoxin system RelE/ParE family toxin [Dyadobacter sp. SG02]|uniref:type II toxin-antitoxin system RelE/ParE family toxin n=1 Tax=Dyadobacter sp. SG02 TaxID=1855291 RepID=UPI000B854F66
MAYKIEWTRLAKEDYTEIVSYLYDIWGDLSAEKFTNNLQASLGRLEEYPFIGKEDNFIPSMRKLVLGKRHSLFYTVYDDIVLIMNIKSTSRKR